VPEFVHIDRSLVVKYGLLQHLASVITINIPVLALEAHAKRTVTALVDAVGEAVNEDGTSHSAGLHWNVI